MVICQVFIFGLNEKLSMKNGRHKMGANIPQLPAGGDFNHKT